MTKLRPHSFPLCPELSRLVAVLHAYPRLCTYGADVTSKDSEADWQRSRRDLARSGRLIARVAALLSTAERTRTPRISSYSLKHSIERALGAYTSNGVVIAAALLVGLTLGKPRGPNLDIGVSRRWVRQLGPTEQRAA
jgi:hypothetical protein